MAKLSPAYREDTPGDLPADIKEYLDSHYLKKLNNLTKPNPKLLVVFSGGSAVGKSTLSQRIAQEFGALVLENDAIKIHILKFKPDISRDELNPLTWKYAMDLYSRLDELTPNGLVVRDGVIDWYFDRILPIFEKHKYPLFIVGFDLSKEERIKLIKARGDKQTTTVDRLIKIIGDHDIHTKRFRKAYTPDIILKEDKIFDHDRVIQELQLRLLDLK